MHRNIGALYFLEKLEYIYRSHVCLPLGRTAPNPTEQYSV
jgi:hypothetical protein